MENSFYIKEAVFISGANKLQIKDKTVSPTELRALFADKGLIPNGYKYRLSYTSFLGEKKIITKENIASLFKSKMEVNVATGTKMKATEEPKKQAKLTFTPRNVKIDFNGITDDFSFENLDKASLEDKIQLEAEKRNISNIEILVWNGKNYAEIGKIPSNLLFKLFDKAEMHLKVKGTKEKLKKVAFVFEEEVIPLGKVKLDIEEIKDIARGVLDLKGEFDFYDHDLKTGKFLKLQKNSDLPDDDSIELHVKYRESKKSKNAAGSWAYTGFEEEHSSYLTQIFMAMKAENW